MEPLMPRSLLRGDADLICRRRNLVATAHPHPNTPSAPSRRAWGGRIPVRQRGAGAGPGGMQLSRGEGYPRTTVVPPASSSTAGTVSAGDGDRNGASFRTPSLPSPSDNPIFEPGD